MAPVLDEAMVPSRERKRTTSVAAGKPEIAEQSLQFLGGRLLSSLLRIPPKDFHALDCCIPPRDPAKDNEQHSVHRAASDGGSTGLHTGFSEAFRGS